MFIRSNSAKLLGLEKDNAPNDADTPNNDNAKSATIIKPRPTVTKFGRSSTSGKRPCVAK